MPRQRIPAEKIEAARQSYFSGKGLREVSKEHGIGYRQLANASKNGGWASERESKGIGREKAVALVARAADQRAEAVERSWQGRLSNVIDSTSEIAETVSSLLAKQDLSGADFKELATLLKILTDTLESLRRLVPDKDTSKRQGSVFSIDPERAKVIAARLRGERQ